MEREVTTQGFCNGADSQQAPSQPEFIISVTCAAGIRCEYGTLGGSPQSFSLDLLSLSIFFAMDAEQMEVYPRVIFPQKSLS